MRAHIAAAFAAVIISASYPAAADTFTIVDANNKVVGPYVNGGAYLLIGGQPVIVYFTNTGFADNPPLYWYESDSCSSTKFIQTDGLVASSGYNPTNGYLSYGSSDAHDIVALSEQYYNSQQKKYVCSNLQGGNTIHVSFVKSIKASTLGFTAPFRINISK